MTKKDNAKDEKDWKRKYFGSLKELETSEQSWEKIEDLLRLVISRLTLITEATSNTKLNDQITLLRKSIRDGTQSKRLVLLIEDISDDIKKLPEDTHNTSKKENISNRDDVISLLQTILDSIITATSQKSDINKFQKILKGSKNETGEDLTQKFSELISSFISVNENRKPENDKSETATDRRNDNRVANGLDRDIDRSIDAKTNTLVAPAVGELILQLITRFPPSFSKRINQNELARAASAARNRKDLMQLIDTISQELSLFIRSVSSKNESGNSGVQESDGEVLIHLLQRISLPDYLSEQALKLKQNIEKGDKESSITNLVEATADLIMQMRLRLQAEKQELEQFLSEISKHLKALDIDIQITSRLRDESSESLQLYDEQLENEVRGLETGIGDTIELDGLKELVNERVKTIRLHMGVFRKSEEQRNSTAEKTITQLTNRISDMEKETESLREQVTKEHNSAIRDALTKIPNRLAYEERINAEIERCKRYKSSMAFVVWDIDHFKGINDHYGHIAGDKVLSVIAEVLRKNLRAADFIARYGGEEFVVIMPETELNEAQKGCEKVRLAIENCNFHYRDTSVPITASCGYTTYLEGDNKEGIFDRADKALYKAKQNGRNQCVQAE